MLPAPRFTSHRDATSWKSSWQNAAQKPRVNKTVLDSSVLLAILGNERTDADLSSVLQGAFVSTVNLAEVLSRVHDDPAFENDALDELLESLLEPQPFTLSQAHLAGRLRPITKSAGLSLGDRACIALGAELDADIYTTDRAWMKLKLPYRIHLIR